MKTAKGNNDTIKQHQNVHENGQSKKLLSKIVDIRKDSLNITNQKPTSTKDAAR